TASAPSSAWPLASPCVKSLTLLSSASASLVSRAIQPTRSKPRLKPHKADHISNGEANNMLTFYILIWPALALCVLVLIVTAFLRELRAARREGRPIV